MTEEEKEEEEERRRRRRGGGEEEEEAGLFKANEEEEEDVMVVAVLLTSKEREEEEEEMRKVHSKEEEEAAGSSWTRRRRTRRTHEQSVHAHACTHTCTHARMRTQERTHSHARALFRPSPPRRPPSAASHGRSMRVQSPSSYTPCHRLIMQARSFKTVLTCARLRTERPHARVQIVRPSSESDGGQWSKSVQKNQRALRARME